MLSMSAKHLKAWKVDSAVIPLKLENSSKRKYKKRTKERIHSIYVKLFNS